jgi:3-isopropylmalate/(R)-2-methylmalate dehydratase small subunit
MEGKILRGKAWVSTKEIYAFDMIQQEHWHKPLNSEEMSKWVMAGVAPGFASENGFKKFGYTFIVAGSNFAGGGKSIEHPIVGLMGAGIKAVIADSFSRLQFRNAINYGLPFVTCKGIKSIVSTGDELEVNLQTGLIRNLTNGKEITGAPVAEFVSEIAEAGGLIKYVKKQLAAGKTKSLSGA